MVRGVSFPDGARRIAELEKSLSSPDLSLSDIETIGEQVLNTETLTKTQQVGRNLLLKRVDERRDQALNDQLEQLKKTHDPVAKIKQLQPLIYFLSPDEVELQFSAIEMETALLTGKDQKTQQAASEQLEHLRFQFEKPVVQELSKETPHSFAEGAQKIANSILNSNSLEPLKHFTPTQLGEISRFIAIAPGDA